MLWKKGSWKLHVSNEILERDIRDEEVLNEETKWINDTGTRDIIREPL